MRLFSMYRNSAGWRVRIALGLKEIAYDYVAVPEMDRRDYLSINPQGLMPALEIDGTVVAQSGAILALLDERYPNPPLLPGNDIERARARSFAQYIAADLHPINNARVRKYLAEEMGQSVPTIETWCRHWSGVALAALEEMLRRRPAATLYAFGDTPGLADLHLVPQLYNCSRYGCDLTAYPLLVAVDRACRGVPAFQRAAPECMPDFPSGEPHWQQVG